MGEITKYILRRGKLMYRELELKKRKCLEKEMEIN